MFYGVYEHTIDRKGRLIVPAKFRQVLDSQTIQNLYLTRGLDGCLFLFPEPEWRAIESRFKQQLPITKNEARRFSRLFFSWATDVQVDALGRVLVPKHLRDIAGIKDDVVVVGVSGRIEVWAKDLWEKSTASDGESYEDLAERILLE
jgi:MraZ protein